MAADDEGAEVPTVMQRLTEAGIDEAKAGRYLDSGRVWLNGETVTDAATPAPRGSTRVTIAGS